MTYSHNSVSKHLKMTTAATAAAAASIRLKNGAVEAGKISGGGAAITPPTTPPPSAHSNSIASNSTNYQFHYHQPMLSSSPSGSSMSSAMSTSSNSSGSSSGSCHASNSSGYYSSVRKHQRQNQQQRRSPHQQQQTESGSYFNTNHQQAGSGPAKRNNRCGASSPKNRDGVQRLPQNYHQSTRQSPASILGGGLSTSPPGSSSGISTSARKPRSKHSSPLLSAGGGKISPTHNLIPTALSHFAGSKCFDAPAPTALPKPPEHWTDCKRPEKATSSASPGLHSVLNAVAARPHHMNHQHHRHGSAHDARSYGGHVVKSSKRNLLDDFDTHNLKLLLNVHS